MLTRVVSGHSGLSRAMETEWLMSCTRWLGLNDAEVVKQWRNKPTCVTFPQSKGGSRVLEKVTSQSSILTLLYGLLGNLKCGSGFNAL